MKKISSFCASKERYPGEVKDKLLRWSVPEEEIPVIIGCLEQENYLNVERFARNYVVSKFNLYQWGKNKIKEGLLYCGLDDAVISMAIREIEDDDYLNLIERLIEKNKNKTNLLAYLINRGFEEDLAEKAINKTIHSN
ncbi:MAG: regulatory protein RecX [Bacteroidetes bacterium]|nr:regulatory protein RecX [Bacteroidota bacterium]